MRLTVGGLVINELGHVLLVHRREQGGWGTPRGDVAAGELPDAAVTRAVETETGFKTLPVRLVGLYFLPGDEDGRLHFQFRSLLRGGTPTPGPGSDAVTYFDPTTLPSSLATFEQGRLEDGLFHAGGPACWRQESRALWRRWLATLGRSAPPYANWSIDVISLIPDPRGALCWAELDGRFRLPVIRPADDEAPWTAAERAARQQVGVARAPIDLAGVFAAGDETMSLVFRAAAGAVAPLSQTPPSLFLPGSEPDSADRQHAALAAAALPLGPTHFGQLSLAQS